jgi:hypothetical protein
LLQLIYGEIGFDVMGKETNNMKPSVLDKIEELFGNPEKFTPENLESIIHETVTFFNELKANVESPDNKVREEALKLAASLQTKLEEQALALCEAVGMDPKAIESYINTPSHFSPDEWVAMEKAKAELEGYKNAVSELESGKAPKFKKPKSVKEWLVS